MNDVYEIENTLHRPVRNDGAISVIFYHNMIKYVTYYVTSSLILLDIYRIHNVKLIKRIYSLIAFDTLLVDFPSRNSECWNKK